MVLFADPNPNGPPFPPTPGPIVLDVQGTQQYSAWLKHGQQPKKGETGGQREAIIEAALKVGLSSKWAAH